jgi:DNA-binding PadR family transcriptional regulator
MNSQNKLLSSLDVFLLALIDSGVTTSYAMREQAGVSVGASRPSLRRLQKLGLVVVGKAAARNKLAFRLTRRGRRAKVTGLNRLLGEFRSSPPSDTESILRIATLAISEARSFEARGLFRMAAEECRRRAKEDEQVMMEPGAGVAGTYLFYTAAFSSAQLQAVSSLFADLALPSRKPTS